jgi:hypothetical protein
MVCRFACRQVGASAVGGGYQIGMRMGPRDRQGGVLFAHSPVGRDRVAGARRSCPSRGLGRRPSSLDQPRSYLGCRWKPSCERTDLITRAAVIRRITDAIEPAAEVNESIPTRAHWLEDDELDAHDRPDLSTAAPIDAREPCVESPFSLETPRLIGGLWSWLTNARTRRTNGERVRVLNSVAGLGHGNP